MKRILLIGVLCLGVLPAAKAAPARIIFLRHAEKPASGPELNERGWERAKALVPLFTSDPRMSERGAIVAIFAMKPDKPGGSVRAIQTMQATSKALGTTLVADLTRKEIEPLVHEILNTTAYDGKTVVICWEHKEIPRMLKSFGWPHGPDQWEDQVYDRLWFLDFEQSKPVRFSNLPQKLLAGDANN